MHTISAGQIRAARVFLNWTREDLAIAANLSASTIRNLEKGQRSFRSTETVRQTLESSGIEFSENEGICRRSDEVRIIRGHDSCDLFYENVVQTLKEKDGGITAIIKSQKILLESLGLSPQSNTESLGKITRHGKAKCLLSDFFDPRIALPEFEFRSISKQMAGPLPYYIYGDKYALILKESDGTFKFVVFRSIDLNLSFRKHFAELWSAASAFTPP